MEEIGNRIKVSGTITYYETGNVYQLTDIVDKLLTSNKDNIKLLEKVDVKAQEITAASLNDTTSYAKEFTSFISYCDTSITYLWFGSLFTAIFN